METLYGFITSMGPQYGFITAMGPLYGFITATGANCYGGPLWLYHWHRGPKFLSAALPVSSHLLIVTMGYGKYNCSLTKVLKKMRQRIKRWQVLLE